MKTTLLSIGALSLLLGVPSAHGASVTTGSTGSAPERHVAASGVGLEFPRQYVPASASLVVHVDLERLQTTTLWKLFKSSDLEVDLSQMREELGFDPLQVVRSVTVYGTEGEPEAVVILANPILDDVLSRFEEKGDLSYFTHAGERLFSLEDTVGFVAHHGADGRVVVLGDGEHAVVEAARVIHGETESLAEGSSSGLRPEPVTGSFLFVAARGVLPGMDDFEPASQVLGLAQGVQFDLGEAGGSLFAHLALDTGSLETARDVSDTVEGLLALARIAMRAGEDVPAELGELLNAVAVRSRGGLVALDFEYSTQALVELLEDLDEQDH